MSGTSGLEDGLQLGKDFSGGVGTNTIITINNDLGFLTVLISDSDSDRDDFFLEETGLLSSGSLLMRTSREFILSLTANVVFFSNVFRSKTIMELYEYTTHAHKYTTTYPIGKVQSATTGSLSNFSATGILRLK